MDSKEIKKVVQQTENELKEKEKEKQIEIVKKIVKKTLEKIEDAKKEKSEIDKRLKYLKMDLDDLKEGHLERIEERQCKDSEAKKYSVIIIVKEKEIIREREVPYPVYPSPWYWPYTITWNSNWGGYEFPINSSTQEIGTTDIVTRAPSTRSMTFSNGISQSSDISINCSIAKDFSAGTYEIGDKIIHFR